jgi:hypothetical protein
MAVEGVLEASSHAAADDLLNTSLLPRAGFDRRLGEHTLSLFPGKPASSHEATEGVGSAVEGVGKPSAFGYLPAGFDRGEHGSEHALDVAAAAPRSQDGLLGARRHGTRSRDVRGRQVARTFKFLGEPGRENSGVTNPADGAVGAMLSGSAWSDDIAAVSSHIDLPGKRTPLTGP